MNPTDTTILSKAGLRPDGEVAKAAMRRANIIQLSQAAEDAVLRPKDFGRFRTRSACCTGRTCGPIGCR